MMTMFNAFEGERCYVALSDGRKLCGHIHNTELRPGSLMVEVELIVWRGAQGNQTEHITVPYPELVAYEHVVSIRPAATL